MDAPWFYCPALHCGEIELDAAEARHVRQSRRLRAGDALTLFDGVGHVGEGVLLGEPDDLSATDKRRRTRPGATRVLISSVEEVPPTSRALTLIVSGCKGARLDWLVEKCTELGVSRLILADFERSVVRLNPGHVEKLRRTAIEACKQCRRARLPEIATGMSLPDACAARGADPLLVAHPSPDAPTLADRLRDGYPHTREVAVVIGPEGGLTDDELNMLRAAGGEIVRLTAHILRVETAAIAVAAWWAL
jgi:16S rRNA (uracil1498-N3)-methyltransferase